MLNPKVHQLVHNYHLFVVPMAAPSLVYNKKAKLTITRVVEDVDKPGATGTTGYVTKTVEKEVRMDFGMLNERKPDPKNPYCFETNTGLILMQMMLRNTFVAVVDLADGDENRILYPYGFVPQTTPQRILEASEGTTAQQAFPAEATPPEQNANKPAPGQTPESPTENPNTPNPASQPNTPQTPAPSSNEPANPNEPPAPSTSTEPGATGKGDEEGTQPNLNDWKKQDDDVFEEYEEDLDEENELSSIQSDPETGSEKQDEESYNPFEGLEQIKWDKMDENWEDISKTISSNFWKAYFDEESTNDDFIFYKISYALAQIADKGSEANMTPFVYGSSRLYDSHSEDNQHKFNMFLDFAYSASFNKYNSNFKKCATSRASVYLQNSQGLHSSFRAIALSIVFKRPNASLSNEKAYGDERAVRFRLFKTQPQNFTIHSKERIKMEKFKFQNSGNKPDNGWTKIGDRFDDGKHGSSSRFILMLFGLADIIQPNISIDHISRADNMRMEFYPKDGTSIDSRYLKKVTGDLNLRLRVRGCLGGVDIWDLRENKLKVTNSEYEPTINETLVNLVLPVDLMNNPFLDDHKSIVKSPSQVSEEGDGKAFIPRPIDGPGEQGRSIPLHLRINTQTNNLLAIKLNLKCLYYDEKKKGLFNKMPQSHFARSIIDPGYFVENPWSDELDFKSANTVFQVSMQDIARIEDSYMIQQKFLANIDVITDFDVFFRFTDQASVVAVAANDLKGKRVKLQPEDSSVEETPKFESWIKIFSYDPNTGEIRFQRNLQELAANWNLQIKFFGDIGCCTTSTQGKPILAIHNGQKDPSYIVPPNIYNLYSKRTYNGSKMVVDINDAKKNDGYGLLFYELLGAGVSLHYRGKLPLRSETMIHSYNRVLESGVQTPPMPPQSQSTKSVRVDISGVSKHSGYDLNNLFAFGYLVSHSPTTTPYAGLMCSDRVNYYLQIEPLANPNHVDLHNDSVGNMLFKVQLFSPDRAEFEIDIEKLLGSKLYYKGEIDHGKRPIHHYTTTINPHMVYSSLSKFVNEERENDMNGSREKSPEDKIEEEFLNDDQSKDFGRVNMWSLLSGRTVKMRKTRQVNPNLRVVDLSFKCVLRNKNPAYQERYALMFKFNPVMKDNSYTSNKFIL